MNQLTSTVMTGTPRTVYCHVKRWAAVWPGSITPIGDSIGRVATATCALSYDDRFFRRKKLTTDQGWPVVVDFDQTRSLGHGDALELSDGRMIEVRAAPEALLAVTGPDLARLAWHIGNRHTPCQIGTDHVLILRDPVIRHMLEHLGANVAEVDAPPVASPVRLVPPDPPQWNNSTKTENR